LLLCKTIVLLSSKINALRKTIDTTGALLRDFEHSIGESKIRGVDVRVALIPGLRAELRLEAQNQKLLLPIRPELNPSRKILDRAAKGDGPAFIVASPHIPDGLAADYRDAGINHADLNGRLFIQTPWLLLDREPREQRHRNPVSGPALFSLKTSRIARALLSQREKSWEQAELTDRTGVSRGLVSRILKTLIGGGYVTQESAGSRHGPASYGLTDFDRLLDSWRAEDNWEKRVCVEQYSLLSGDAGEIARSVRDALGAEHAVFTQWFAAHLRHPYTTPPVVSAYVQQGRRPLELKFARQVPNGGNLWLIAPEDEGVFLETQEQSGFRLVSDVQIYLDLLQMGQRGPDAAQALRAWDGFSR
jgi:hypothetical protein